MGSFAVFWSRLSALIIPFFVSKKQSFCSSRNCHEPFSLFLPPQKKKPTSLSKNDSYCFTRYDPLAHFSVGYKRVQADQTGLRRRCSSDPGCTLHHFMRNELCLDYRFVFVSGFAAFHCAQTCFRASLTFIRNMRYNLIWFPVKFHALSFMSGLSARFSAVLFPETFRSGFVEPVVGWRRIPGSGIRRPALLRLSPSPRADGNSPRAVPGSPGKPTPCWDQTACPCFHT